jgi:hypothetical protein
VRKAVPTRDQLLAMVEHVAYDMVEVRDQYRALVHIAVKPHEVAAMDAFLLHSRNLLGFYWPPSEAAQWTGDVYAFDYIEGYVPPHHLIKPSIQELKKTISTRLAHLCLARIEKVVWYPQVINEALTNAISDFLSRVEEPYKAEFARSKAWPRTSESAP